MTQTGHGAGHGWRSLNRRQWGVLGCTLLANALVFFDQTSVTVALPSIGRELGTDASQLQWVITIYLLALAVFMLVVGRVADHLGRRRTFLCGLVVFGIGSALCAAAPNLPLLLAARFVQGVGGAVVQPLALSSTTRAVSNRQRGWAIGLLSTGGTSFLALGPVMGGGLVAIGWRWLFVANLPVVVLALVLGLRWITPSREQAPKPIGWGGVGLLLIGLTGLVVGVVEVADLGAPAVVAVAVGLIALVLFVRHERRTAHPLIDFSLLRDRLLASSLASLFAIQFAVFGLTVPLTLYLQHGLGESALAAGVVMAVAGGGTPLLSVTTGRLADRRGSRALVLPGLVLATIGLAEVGLLAPVGGVWVLLPGLVAFAIARPLVFTPASTAPFVALGGERRAFAASLATESRQLGAVFGVALTSAALTAVHGPMLRESDQALVDGFRAAVLVAAVVCGVAAALIGWRMPAPGHDTGRTSPTAG